MLHFIYLIQILCLLNPHMKSDNSFRHFYMYDTSTQPEYPKHQFGTMEIKGNKLIKKENILDKEEWVKIYKLTIDQLKKDKNGLIIYIHGYQGDNKYFMQQSGYLIQNKIFDQVGHSYGMALSVQWKSVIPYETAVNNALIKGHNFAPMLDSLYDALKSKYPKAPIAIISHSMGNRVWQGIYTQWLSLRPDLHLDRVLMFAADLESDIFTTSFTDLENKANKVYIFHHLGDKTLQMANAIKSHKRLGIVGPDNKSTLPHNFTIKDMTSIKDDETFAGNLTLHRYYYGSPTVRQEIVKILGE